MYLRKGDGLYCLTEMFHCKANKRKKFIHYIRKLIVIPPYTSNEKRSNYTHYLNAMSYITSDKTEMPNMNKTGFCPYEQEETIRYCHCKNSTHKNNTSFNLN